jgi:phosphate/sulfate permease
MGSASTMKIVGIVLLVVGVGLAFWGYQISESVGSQITQTVTGSYTDKAMLLFIGGAASFVAGLFLFIKK